jgi:creatinine amidohydrolase/Fe(II)-dependent formamide hydrolase-like protein
MLHHGRRLFVLVGHLQQTGLLKHIADQLNTDR